MVANLRYHIILLCAILVPALVHCNKGDGKLIFEDDFIGTSFDSAWVLNKPAGSSLTLVFGEVRPEASAANLTAMPSLMYREKVTGNFKVAARFSISGGTYTGRGYLVARSQASDTTLRSYYCGYSYESITAKSYFMLGRFETTQLVDLAVQPMHSLTAGISDMLYLSFNGSKIQCEISGQSAIVITADDSTYAEGYIGLTGGGPSGNYLYFDLFKAEKL